MKHLKMLLSALLAALILVGCQKTPTEDNRTVITDTVKSGAVTLSEGNVKQTGTRIDVTVTPGSNRANPVLFVGTEKTGTPFGYTGDYYAVGYAVSESPLGPFEKYAHNPILVGNSQIHGVGHHCVVTIPQTGEMWMVYHCHFSLTEVQERKICIDRMRFSPVQGDIDRIEVYGPTVTPQPMLNIGQ